MSQISLAVIDDRVKEYIQTAKKFIEHGKFDHALAYLYRGLSLAEVVGEGKHLQKIKTLIARTHHQQNWPDLAIEWCDQALQEENAPEERATVLEMKIINLMKKGYFKRAAIFITELMKSPYPGIQRIGYMQQGILNVYFFRYLKYLTLDKAEEYFKKAKKLVIDDDDRALIQVDYCWALYLVEEGLFFYAKEKLLAILNRTVDKVPQIFLYNELGKVSMKLMEYENSFEYLNKARNLAIEISFKSGLTYNVYYRGLLHMEYSHHIEHAYIHFLTALFDFQKRKQYPEVSLVYYQLYQLYLPVNVEKAEKYLKEYRKYLTLLDLEDVAGLEDVHAEEMYQWMNT